jgi:outer membrane protein OmpA-like peptidoglycan-associated protein
LLPLRAVYAEGKLSFEGTRPSPEALDAMLKTAKTGLGDANVSTQFAETTGVGGSVDSYSQFGAALSRFNDLKVRSAIIDVSDIETTITGRIANESSRAEIVQSLGLSSGRVVNDNLEVEAGSSDSSTTPESTSVSDGTPAAGAVTTLAANPTATTGGTLAPAAREALQTEVNTTLKSSRIEFATDSSVISVKSLAVIADLAEVLKTSGVAFEVSGHTDSRGRAERNLALSQSRADAVKAEFVKQGIVATKITAKGYGSQKTIAADNDSKGNPLNRRIEITLQ